MSEVRTAILRTVHEMASQLGIVQGVIVDADEGYPLTREDITDGRQAAFHLGDLLRKLRRLAAELRE